MTTTGKKSVACALCGEVSEFSVLRSFGLYGEFDLDGRPPSLLRHTMRLWLQECAGCGYVSKSIDELLPNAAAIVRSPEYVSLRTMVDQPSGVLRFLRHALLWAHEPAEAGQALLHAAWIYDDMGRDDLALACREECAQKWSALPWASDSATMRLRRQQVDVLRRARRFQAARSLIERIRAADAPTGKSLKILSFQERLCERQDAAGFTEEDALAGVARPV